MRALPLTLLSGVLLALALPPFNVGWLGWIAVAPLFLAVRGRRGVEALGLGLLAGVLCGVIHVGWHPDGRALHFAYLPFLWLAMLLGFVAAFAAATGRILLGSKNLECGNSVAASFTCPHSPPDEVPRTIPSPHTSVLHSSRGLTWLLLVASAGVALEWVTTFTPLPLNLAISQHQALPILQVASVTGVWGVSFLVWWINAALADALARGRLTRGVLAGALMLAAAAGFGQLRLARLAAHPGGSVRVAAVQEFSQAETAGFTGPEAAGLVEGDRDEMSRQAVAQGAQLIVWSEGCLGAAFSPQGRRDPTVALARQLEAHLVVGYSESATPRSFNCAAVVTPNGQVAGVHRKIHLFMGERQAVQPGREARAFDTALGRLGMEICFDSCYTGVTRRLAADGARLVAMPNYDPPTPRGVLHRLHAAVLPFRAVENALPIVRADPNGCSQIIDAAGRIRAQSPLYAPDLLVAALPLGDGHSTPFTRLGDWFAYLAIAVTLLGSVSLRRPDRSPNPTC